MSKIIFKVDSEIDDQFPQRRICRAEIVTADNHKYVSSECEPRGEAHENIGFDWISEKFRRITEPVITQDFQEYLLRTIEKENDISVVKLVDEINSNLKITF